MQHLDNPTGDGTDETVADGQPVDLLSEEFFREQVARIVAETCRESAGGDPPSSLGGPTYY
jgi:hypothetical protein